MRVRGCLLWEVCTPVVCVCVRACVRACVSSLFRQVAHGLDRYVCVGGVVVCREVRHSPAATNQNTKDEATNTGAKPTAGQGSTLHCHCTGVDERRTDAQDVARAGRRSDGNLGVRAGESRGGVVEVLKPSTLKLCPCRVLRGPLHRFEGA